VDARWASTAGAGTAAAGFAFALQAVVPSRHANRATVARENEFIRFSFRKSELAHLTFQTRKSFRALKICSSKLRARTAASGSTSPSAFHIFLDFSLYLRQYGRMAITRRQHEVYDFISRFVTEHGYSPSFEEIGQGMQLNSLATVHKHITNLEKKGLLTRDYNRSRSIDLLPPKGKLKQSMSVNTAVVLPLLGRIAAGQPIEAVENPETISLADFVRSKEVFVLEVRGDSMQDEAILDGDYVLVENARTAHNGDIVVALVDSTDATLKRFYREGDKIRLQPSNVTMKPIIVPAASVDVQGRVIGVLRKY
jgi:repressor LexA